MKIAKQLLTGLILVASATTASALTINDKYTGSNFANDVLGNDDNYNIQSMNVTLTGNILSVSINTNFAGKTGTLLKSNTLGNTGIGYGDLFIGSTWTPFGTAPYLNDNATTGTVWDYGFSLDDRFSNVNTTGTLYSLNSGDNDANALLSDDFMTAGSYRHNQEVAVDTTSDVTAMAGTSNWNVDAANGKINFLIDITGTSLENATSLSLHWGMSCANDVIEAGRSKIRIQTVAEPALLGLIGIGLLGLGFSKRKKA